MAENDPSDDGGNGDEPNGSGGTDGGTERLSPKRAFELHENNGMSYAEIAGIYDVSKSTVKRRKDEHKESMKTGKEKVDPTDFEREQLESALEDKKQEDDEYECSSCGKTMDYMEYEECPNCGTTLGWSQI